MEQWWELLENMLKTHNIKPENIYGTNEVGIQTQGQGKHECIFGQPGKTAPYQQCAGTQENITLIVTICTNGSALPPTVIFKGKAYHIKWANNNPLHALFVIDSHA